MALLSIFIIALMTLFQFCSVEQPFGKDIFSLTEFAVKSSLGGRAFGQMGIDHMVFRSNSLLVKWRSEFSKRNHY
jgi:hypothetical protein